MKRNVFGALRFPDDESAEKLSAHIRGDDARRERIFAMSEKRFEEMKAKEKENIGSTAPSSFNDGVETVKIGGARWSAPLRTAAAFVCVAVICVGAFGVIRAKEPPASDAEDESITVRETPDDIAERAAEHGADNVSKKKVAASQSASEPEKKAASSASAASSSKAQGGETSGVSAQADEAERDEHQPKADESAEPNELTDTAQDTPERITDEPTASEEPIGEIDVQIGITQSDKVLKITKDMSYKEAMELLGTPNDLMEQGSFAQYIVDGEYLLMLDWDYDTDLILRDGRELLDSCPRLSEMMNDPENRTFDCYIVQYNGAGIKVTCPQYDLFDCASIGVGTHSGGYDEAWNEVIGRAMSDGRALRITHDGDILEVYPPLVTAVSIELAPER